MTLTRSQIQDYYNRFGAKQDSQSFYEDAALDDLIGHAEFESAESVFEFGSGTGRFASRILAKHLPGSASYVGIDLSQTMVSLARRRVEPYHERAKIELSDGAIHFPVADRSVDRVVSAYVFDLLADSDMQKAVDEAARVLSPTGKLCLVSLTSGSTLTSKFVSASWWVVYRMSASLVGGCRPIQLRKLFESADWSVDYRNVVIGWGVPSEVLIASPIR